MAAKIAFIALIVVLGVVNWSIAQKERQLTSGEIVYLTLAPVDPRSLMQGDYMALRYRVGNAVYAALPKSDSDRPWRHRVTARNGYVVVSLDSRQVGTFKRLDDGKPLAPNELRLHYRVRDGVVKFATNAFFFQEGRRKDYQDAHYGRFRVNAKGDVLLTGLYDKQLHRLGPPRK